MSYSSLNDLVAHFESGGNYDAQNSSSTASGAYQFTNATWQQYAPSAGVNLSVYPTAISAPASVQDSVFANTVSQVGLQPWTCTGCDAGLTSYLAANPSAASLPVSSPYSVNAATTSIQQQMFGPNALPTVGIGQTLAGYASSAAAASGVTAYLAQGGIILLGIAIILVALVFMFIDGKTTPVTWSELAGKNFA